MIGRLVLLLGVLVSGCASSSVDGDALARRVDALLADAQQGDGFSGAVVITRDGRTVYAGGVGFADPDGRRPFTPDTPTAGASLTKTVTAAAVLLLAAEGRLALDAPVARYVPEFPHRATTVRQLLSHAGGLPDYDAFQPLLDAGKPVSTLDLLRDLEARRITPSAEPGTAFAYCNLCYDTLALAVERVSGSSFEAFARERLLGPAGMTSTYLRPARLADWRGERARGYRRKADKVEAFDVFDNEGFYGGDGFYFTARDLGAWTAAWAASTAAPKARALALTPARVGGMQTGLTLGSWYCAADRRRCWYRGHHQGFHNLAYWDAGRRQSVVFVSNNTLSAPLQIGLARGLVAVAEGRRPEPFAPPGAPIDLSGAPGSYRAPGLGLIEVAAEERLMRVRVGQGPSYRAFPMGQGLFYAPGLDAYLGFEALEAGRYRRLRWRTVAEDATGVRL